MSNKITTYWEDFLKYLRSTDFSKAMVLTAAIASAVGIFQQLGHLEIGVTLAMGVLLSSPSDIPGNFRHRNAGVVLAALLAGTVSVIIGYAAPYLWLVLPLIGILMFGIAYFAVYGFRASLIAFSGLFAIVLSFANVSTLIVPWERGLLIVAGGLWYLTLSNLWGFIHPKHHTEKQLAECLELTAKYLKTRAHLLTQTNNREALQRELFLLQSDLSDKHEALRNLIISNRRASGNSNYARKRLLIFIELVDVLELAMANPVDYKKMDEVLQEDQDLLEHFKKLIKKIAYQLDEISIIIEKKKKASVKDISYYLKSVEEDFKAVQNLIASENTEKAFLLQNLFDYLEKQGQKINTIVRILHNLETQKTRLMKNKEASQFITPQDYSPDTLLENFNFGSPIFRHSLRLAIVVLVGFSVGLYFSFDNAYWIILTIVVIMRPNYGLTKDRSKQRIIGTLIGAVIAIGLVTVIKNPVIYAILGLFSLTLAFSLIQRNYRTAAVFITLSIVFIYSLLQPNVFNVIQFRVVDTLLGAGLAALGNIILWPTWEVQNIKSVITASINANIKYLKEIDSFYRDKGRLPTSYKLSRKKAFLEMGNLSASFQRMTQEPKLKQKDLDPIYKLVGLNQTFLSALASLGTFIRNHETTAASESFNTFVQHICTNLKNARNGLEDNPSFKPVDKEHTQKAASSLLKHYKLLLAKREQQLKESPKNTDNKVQVRLQEAQLISSQLQWLLEISENLKKCSSQTKFK
ncbi:TIGR01666 family membrane protein [Salegentibacter echinorum]|uniref:TIGR01666 family membrane protein n=1 Tax=Salegentibacter echinorum TaxID=1073325 RepID=A0A1M5I1T8_SALEC|nr:FUSC family membrane protein [Salegentibacter echinorum]SHG22000.1 TIGR01666 family membrane protein [Salegentibacter echinorum]